MARPKKKGMDYFPHDVDAVNDEKIEALRAMYGNDGYAFYFIMLERIYRTKNFELDVSDAETKEETFQILSRKMMITSEIFTQILKTSLKWNCFDKKIYEQKSIITSSGIKERAKVVIDKRQKMQQRYQDKQIVSEAETGEETREETPQSKVKKSKEKKSKEKKRKEDDTKKSSSELINFYNNNYGMITQFISESMFSFLEDGVEEDLMLRYLEIGVENNARNWNYVKTIAQRNFELNIKTLEQFNTKEVERKNKNTGGQNNGANQQSISTDDKTLEELQKEHGGVWL